ncbi:MAG TPA: hypothetical protein VHA07_10005 [Devosia sp.]|nr:hypothetical protein [Devosia sp.]
MPRYYSARLVKSGPIVGVKLFFGAPVIDGEELDRSPRLQCLVDTETSGRYVWQLDDRGAPLDVEGCMLRQVTPIDEAEYRFLTARAQWAAEHKPEHIAAAPQRRIDLTKMPGIF